MTVQTKPNLGTAQRLIHARRTLRHPEVLERPKNLEGLFTFDLVQDSRE